jgi:hypothetical protein
VGLNSLKSLNLTNGYPNNTNKVKSKPLELFELAGKNKASRAGFEPGSDRTIARWSTDSTTKVTY